MTNDKARDFFSSYFEGTLDAGLSLSLEQKLKADEDLRAEYQAFVRAMDSLDVLKFEEIEIPHDLHERIAARLDRHVWERKQTATPFWKSWGRSACVAGVAAVAVIGALVALRSNSNGVREAGTVPTSNPAPMTFNVATDGLELRPPSGTQAVKVLDEQGRTLSQVNGSAALNPTKLTNTLPGPALFGVQLNGERVVYFALPGKDRKASGEGQGSVLQFAKALADFYRTPVRVDVAAPTASLEWSLRSTDAVTEAGRWLGGGYRVTQLNDLLEIEKS